MAMVLARKTHLSSCQILILNLAHGEPCVDLPLVVWSPGKCSEYNKTTEGEESHGR